MNQRINKRELMFGIGLLLLVLLPIGGAAIYKALRPVAEPKQQVQIKVPGAEKSEADQGDRNP